MAKRVVNLADGRPLHPLLSVIVCPGSSGSRVNILMGADLLGNGYRPPVGTLGLRVRACDLVGLTPAAAALRCLEPLVRVLAAVVGEQARAKPPAPPSGVTGASVQVPGQMSLPLG